MAKPMKRILLTITAAALFGCGSSEPGAGIRPLKKEPFGTMPDGRPVDIYTLTNANGMEARVTTYGGILVSLSVPDRDGQMADVVLGFDTLEEYLAHRGSGGAIVGRHAGRLSGAKLTLNGVQHQLTKNEGEDNVHGGKIGFHARLWNGRDVSTADEQRLELTYLSEDGEEGFPGNLQVTVIYSLNGSNELGLHFSAATDQDTVVNLMNHMYLNLAGYGEGNILDHELTVFADKYTPLNEERKTVGEYRDVAGTPFDFREPTAIGARIEDGDEQLQFGRGYDHHMVLNSGGGPLELAARVREPASGRVLEIITTETSVLLYSGNKLNGKTPGKGGKFNPHRSAFALEVQHLPDGPSIPLFPSTVLKAGDRYHQTTVLRFSTDRE